MPAFAFLPLDPASLSAAAGKLFYSAQTFLPGQSFATAANRVPDLVEILRRNENGTYENGEYRNPGSGAADDAETESERIQREHFGGVRENIENVGNAVNAFAAWGDLQRVVYLLLGLALLWIGVYFITQNASTKVSVELEGGPELISQRLQQNIERQTRPKPPKVSKARKSRFKALKPVDEHGPDLPPGTFSDPPVVEHAPTKSLDDRSFGTKFGRKKNKRNG
jgi:hypothetical protein